jgi:uncharacterized protein
MADPIARGQFVWHELVTSDLDAAAAFYGKTLGWSVQAYPDNPNYRLWTSRGVQRAGLMLLPAEARARGAGPHWMTYISTPEVDATTRQAEQLGGRVLVPPMDIPKVGRFAVLKDPQTAVFSVFNPIPPDEALPEPGGMGDFTWHELVTTDWRAAWRFYQALFGWELIRSMDMGEAGTYEIFGRKGTMLGGMYNTPPGSPAPHWLPYTRVPNVDSVAASIPGAGGKVFMQPMEVPGGDRVAGFTDPQGARLAVHALAAKQPESKAPARKKNPKKTSKKTPKKKAAKKKAPKKTASKKKVTRKKARRRR